MSNSWSKEDRFHYQKSEVFQELEKGVLDTIRRVDILQQKITLAATMESLKALEDQANETAKAVAPFLDEAADEVANEAADEVAGDAWEEGLQNEVVDDLRDLVTAALSEGNLKLAYRIERTIDEILEQEVVCE